MADREIMEGVLSLLEQGAMEKASLQYEEALRKDPSSLEFQCGFYSARWWHNRVNSYNSLKKGRPLAAWLMSEWEKFAEIAEERRFSSCLSYQAVMRAVLEDAADNFRIAFQEEGTSSVDISLLRELSICLMRLKDYRNAAEILNYARRKNNRDAGINFLLGEALCCLGKKDTQERGLSYLRDALLIDLHSIRPDLIASESSSQLFEQLYESHEQKLEPALNWFPAYLTARYFLPGIRQLENRELSYIHSEIERLEQNMESVIPKYRERVRSGLSFYILLLIHHYKFHNPQRRAEAALKEKLQELSPELHSFLRQHAM